jgi:hypothetical protein
MATCETCGQTLPEGDGDQELTIDKIKTMTVEEVAARLDEVNAVLVGAGDDGEA